MEEAAGLEIGDIGDEEWDEFLRAHPEGHHEQCSAYARRRADVGFTSARVAVRHRGRVVGGAQVLARSSPIGTFAWLRYGPLALNGRRDILERAAEGLDAIARRRGYVSLRVDTFPNQEEARLALERVGFRASESWPSKVDSRVVPLDGDDEARLARMASKGRYNVRLARRSGVSVVAEGAEGLPAFYDLHLQTAEYQDFPVFDRAYYDEIWGVFGATGRIRVLTARHESTPIASIILCVVGDRCYYGWGGMSRDPEHRKRMPNYLLHFTGMGWAKSAGCAHYDLVGVSDFKEKLGGDPLVWPYPLRKFYGVWRGPRRAALGLSWRRPWLRRCVQAVSRRLYARMPF